MPRSSSSPSFIPKEKESFELPNQARSTALDPLVLIGITVFLAVLAVWTGMVLYGRYVEAETAVLERTLKQEERLLNEKVVEHLLATDRQFSAARRLVDRHLAPSRVFTILEDRTVDGLRYTSFSYEGAPDGGEAVVSLAGEAGNFSAVVEQSEILAQAPEITQSQFSGLDRDRESGRIRFSLELSLPISDLRYRDTVDDSDPDPDSETAADLRSEEVETELAREASGESGESPADDLEDPADSAETSDNPINQ